MATEGLRARRRRELKAEINRVALRLLAEKGYNAVSLQEIAEEAGISLRTLFRHFSHKDAVFGFGIELREQQILQRFAERPDDEPLIESYLHAIRVMVDDYISDPEVARNEFGLLREVPGLRAQYLVPSPEHETDAMDGEFARRLGCAPTDGRMQLLRYCLVNAVVQATSVWRRSGGGGDLHAQMRAYISLFEPMIEKIRVAS
ncbi:MAG: TetR/AcrR family transcriptional regulator [Sphingomonadaceae bacterium]